MNHIDIEQLNVATTMNPKLFLPLEKQKKISRSTFEQTRDLEFDTWDDFFETTGVKRNSLGFASMISVLEEFLKEHMTANRADGDPTMTGSATPQRGVVGEQEATGSERPMQEIRVSPTKANSRLPD